MGQLESGETHNQWFRSSIRLYSRRSGRARPRPAPNQIAANTTSRVQISLNVPSAGLLAVRTVFVIVMENQDWQDIQGSTDCPYINNVILPMASYCTQFNTPNDLHPSEPIILDGSRDKLRYCR